MEHTPRTLSAKNISKFNGEQSVTKVHIPRAVRYLFCEPNSRHIVEGGTQALGQFESIVVCPEMHEEQPRLLVEHVTVQRGHRNPVLPQRRDHLVDLAPHEHEVAEMGAKVHIPKSTKPMDIVILIEQLLARNKYLQS